MSQFRRDLEKVGVVLLGRVNSTTKSFFKTGFEQLSSRGTWQPNSVFFRYNGDGISGENSVLIWCGFIGKIGPIVLQKLNRFGRIGPAPRRESSSFKKKIVERDMAPQKICVETGKTQFAPRSFFQRCFLTICWCLSKSAIQNLPPRI